MGPGGAAGPARPGSAACASRLEINGPGGGAGPGKGRGSARRQPPARLGPTHPTPPGARPLPRGRPEGVGPPGGAGRRSRHPAQRYSGTATQPRAVAALRAAGTGRLPPLSVTRRVPPAACLSVLLPPPACGPGTASRVREGFASPKCRAAAPRCSRPARSRPPSRPAAARAGGPGSPRRPTPPAPWNLAPPSPPRCHGHCLSDGRALPRSSRRQAVKRGYGRGKGKEAEPGREGGRWGGTPAGQGGAGRGELPGAGGRRRAEGPRGRCLAGVCGRTPTARFVPCARTAFYSRCRKRSFCNKTRRERSLGAVYKALSRDLGSQHHRGWRRSPAPIRAPAPQRHIPRPLRSPLGTGQRLRRYLNR